MTPLDGQLFTASNFGPFDAVADFSSSGTGDGSLNSSASQHSRINADSIVANGALSASSQSSNWDLTVSSGCSVTFTLDQPAPYELAGSFIGSLSTSLGRYHMTLTNASSQTIALLVFEFTNGSRQASSGMLPAGSYTLDVSISHVAHPLGQPGTTNMSYSWYFSLPTPSSAAMLGLGSLIATRRRR